MTSFEVHGPFKIKYVKRGGGRVLVFDEFWSEHAETNLAGRRGCYVFAMKNKNLTPIYVGKATNSFIQETFNAANRYKYQSGFSHYAQGTPLMYFVVHPTQPGPTNAAQIAAIEDFLIQAGVAKNPKLQNVKGAQQPSWSIKGVIRSSAGKRSHAETQFSSLFGIK